MYSFFVCHYVFVHICFELGESFLAVLFLSLGFISLLLHVCKLDLHRLQATFLFHNGLLYIVFLLLLLTLLINKLLLENIHLFLVLLFNRLNL